MADLDIAVVNLNGEKKLQPIVQIGNATESPIPVAIVSGGGGGSGGGGDASSALQTVGNTKLTSIDGKTPPLVNGGVPSVGIALKTIIDKVSDAITYVCEAAPGSAAASAVWRVTRIETVGSVKTVSPAGTGAFDQIAANRASLSY